MLFCELLVWIDLCNILLGNSDSIFLLCCAYISDKPLHCDARTKGIIPYWNDSVGRVSYTCRLQQEKGMKTVEMFRSYLCKPYDGWWAYWCPYKSPHDSNGNFAPLYYAYSWDKPLHSFGLIICIAPYWSGIVWRGGYTYKLKGNRRKMTLLAQVEAAEAD